MFFICNFNKRRLQHRCFTVKFVEFLRTLFLTEHLRWLLLHHCKIRHYRLRILLTIPLHCNMIPRLFQLNFAFFLPGYIFLLSYSKLLRRKCSLKLDLKKSESLKGFCNLFVFSFLFIIIKKNCDRLR